MALVSCPECSKEVSDKAAYCIHCGCPLHSSQTAPRLERPPMSEETIQTKPVRMSHNQTIIAVILAAISAFLPLVWRLYFISGPSAVSSIACIVVATLAIFQPKKKELLCVFVLTVSLIISFVESHFIYGESLTYFLLMQYAALFLLVAIYWFSAVGIINTKIVPIIATLGYSVSVVILACIASIMAGRYLGSRLLYSLCDVAFYSSCCIIICDSMKRLHHRMKSTTTVNDNSHFAQDNPSIGFAVLCFLFPIVGLILFCVWYDTRPQRAKSAGIGGLAGFCIGAILSTILYASLF